MTSDFLIKACYMMDECKIVESVNQGEIIVMPNRTLYSSIAQHIWIPVTGLTPSIGVAIRECRNHWGHKKVVIDPPTLKGVYASWKLSELNEDCQLLILLRLNSMSGLLTCRTQIAHETFEKFCRKEMEVLDVQFNSMDARISEEKDEMDRLRDSILQGILIDGEDSKRLVEYESLCLAKQSGKFTRKTYLPSSEEYLGALWDQFMMKIQSKDYCDLVKAYKKSIIPWKRILAFAMTYGIVALMITALIFSLWFFAVTFSRTKGFIETGISFVMKFAMYVSPNVGNWLEWLIVSKIKLYVASVALSYTSWRGTAWFHNLMNYIVLGPWKLAFEAAIFAYSKFAKYVTRGLNVVLQMLSNQYTNQYETDEMKRAFIKEFQTLSPLNSFGEFVKEFGQV